MPRTNRIARVKRSATFEDHTIIYIYNKLYTNGSLHNRSLGVRNLQTGLSNPLLMQQMYRIIQIRAITLEQTGQHIQNTRTQKRNENLYC